MIEKYHDPIFKLITEKKEALGVNTIAKETDIALSTVQKYLTTQQTYFKKTGDRKWDLPERVKQEVSPESLQLMINGLENSILLIQTQTKELQQSIANLVPPINILKRNIRDSAPPVAETPILNEKLVNKIASLDKLPKVIKSRKDSLTDDMYEMLMNTDWYGIFVDLGYNYLQEVIEPELYDLLLGTKIDLSEDALSTIKEYQKDI